MSDEERPLLQPSSHKLPGASICPAKHLCLPSKATTLIILWTAVVGAIYIIFLSAVIVAVTGLKHSSSTFVVLDSIPFTIIAMVMMFYPLGGFMADVCLGRFRIIMISLFCIFLSLSLVCVLYLTATITHYGTASAFIKEGGALVILALLLFTIGLVGYQSNFIQFGLDQLLDAPIIKSLSWALHSLCFVGIQLRSCFDSNRGNFLELSFIKRKSFHIHGASPWSYHGHPNYNTNHQLVEAAVVQYSARTL